MPYFSRSISLNETNGELPAYPLSQGLKAYKVAFGGDEYENKMTDLLNLYAEMLMGVDRREAALYVNATKEFIAILIMSSPFPFLIPAPRLAFRAPSSFSPTTRTRR